MACSFVPGFFSIPINLVTNHTITNFHPTERCDDAYMMCHIPVFQNFFICPCILEHRNIFVDLCSRCKTQLSVNFTRLNNLGFQEAKIISVLHSFYSQNEYSQGLKITSALCMSLPFKKKAYNMQIFCTCRCTPRIFKWRVGL